MKRAFMGLVLCLTMIFNLAVATVLMCVPVRAAAFNDADQIAGAYKSAVEDMTTRGIINGFPDGTFQPEGTLTREQAAKIITYMKIGAEAEALTNSNSPFEDLESGYWSTPYVVWCVEQQIILGYGNGKFGPQDHLTGFQFAKMLMVALGLAREGNYVGAGDMWDDYVYEDGLKVGLFDGDIGMATNEAINREQAALLAFNAIKASMSVNVPVNNDGGAEKIEEKSDNSSYGRDIVGPIETPHDPAPVIPTDPSSEEMPRTPTAPENDTETPEAPDPGDDGSSNPGDEGTPGEGDTETPEVGFGGDTETPDPGAGGERPGDEGTPEPGDGGNDTETPETPDPGVGGGNTPKPWDDSKPIELPELP